MITFEKSDGVATDAEKDIFNTNPTYTMIAFDKDKLDESDLVEQYREVEAFNTERYFIKENGSTIGIIEYGMESPRSGKPWLSLLVIDGRVQGRGYAKKVFAMYEDMMKEKHADIIQIAVHAENRLALRFWQSLGFEIYDEREYEGKQYYSLEKKLEVLYEE